MNSFSYLPSQGVNTAQMNDCSRVGVFGISELCVLI